MKIRERLWLKFKKQAKAEASIINPKCARCKQQIDFRETNWYRFGRRFKLLTKILYLHHKCFVDWVLENDY